MSRQLFISSLFIFLFLPTYAFTGEKAQPIKGPIIITSTTLIADNQAHTVLFENSVIARSTDMTLNADQMLVHYDEESGDITKIIAKGNIKLIKGTRVITAKEAAYYADKETIIFTGDPRAIEKENVVTGKKMTYYLDEDRFLVEESKVFLKRKKGQ